MKTKELTGVRELTDAELADANGGLLWRVGDLYCGAFYDPIMGGRIFCGAGHTVLAEIPF